jgi:hypothetical protein
MKHSLVHVAGRNQALDLAVKVMYMINCTSELAVAVDLEYGSQVLLWQDDMSLEDLLNSAFPKAPVLDWPDHSTVCAAITARRLVKVGGLRLLPTSNIHDHLRIEDDSVMIFDNMPFLSEHVRASDAK